MLLAFTNTTIILAFSLVGTILIGSMAAYAIDRFTFRLRRVVIGAFLLATLVPGVTTQVATFQVVNRLELFNTRWSAIVLFLGTLGLVFLISWRVDRLQPSTAFTLFMVYAGLLGVMLSSIFIVYTGVSISRLTA